MNGPFDQDHFGDLQNNLLLVDMVVVIEGIVDVGIVVVDGIVEDGRSWWWNRCFRNLYESADGLAVFGK